MRKAKRTQQGNLLLKFIIYLRPWLALWPVFIMLTLKIFLQTSNFFDMTNVSMVIIIGYNDHHHHRISIDPLDPDCRIAVSAVYSIEPWGP